MTRRSEGRPGSSWIDLEGLNGSRTPSSGHLGSTLTVLGRSGPFTDFDAGDFGRVCGGPGAHMALRAPPKEVFF